jgi:hypothetical protein
METYLIKSYIQQPASKPRFRPTKSPKQARHLKRFCPFGATKILPETGKQALKDGRLEGFLDG